MKVEGFIVASATTYLIIGYLWSAIGIGSRARLFDTSRQMLLCWVVNFFLWPVGMVYRYRRIKRMREADGRVVF